MSIATEISKLQLFVFEKLVDLNKIRLERYLFWNVKVHGADLQSAFAKFKDQSEANLANLQYWRNFFSLPEIIVNPALTMSSSIPIIVNEDRLSFIKASLEWEKQALQSYNEALSLTKVNWNHAGFVTDIGHQREGIELARMKLKALM